MARPIKEEQQQRPKTPPSQQQPPQPQEELKDDFGYDDDDNDDDPNNYDKYNKIKDLTESNLAKTKEQIISEQYTLAQLADRIDNLKGLISEIDTNPLKFTDILEEIANASHS